MSGTLTSPSGAPVEIPVTVPVTVNGQPIPVINNLNPGKELYALFDEAYPLPAPDGRRSAPFAPYLVYVPDDFALSLAFSGWPNDGPRSPTRAPAIRC